MIKFKVKVSRFKKETIYLPSSWSDLTLEQWYKIQALNDNQTDEIFKIIIGSDLKINHEQILPFMGWISEPLDIEQFEVKETKIDVFGNSFQKKIEFQMELSNGKLLESIPKLLTIYLGKNERYYSKLKISESIPLVKGVISEFEKILIQESKAFKKKVDPDEVQAGINNLNMFLDFNTIDEIAKSYPQYTHEQVEKLKYHLVYLISLRKHFLHNFETNLREIKSNKK